MTIHYLQSCAIPLPRPPAGRQSPVRRYDTRDHPTPGPRSAGSQDDEDSRLELCQCDLEGTCRRSEIWITSARATNTVISISDTESNFQSELPSHDEIVSEKDQKYLLSTQTSEVKMSSTRTFRENRISLFSDKLDGMRAG